MTTTISAIFDGTVFVPDEPVHLPQLSRCTLVVETADGAVEEDRKEIIDDQWLLDQIEKLPPADLPSDFAAQHDHYLYGTPKR